jgi:glycosyltransferase involved in cell wall biosynthesis
MTETSETLRLSLIGFGKPSDPNTTSGFARSLYTAVEKSGCLRDEYSLRQFRPADLLRGALRLRSPQSWYGVEINRAWMWSEAGCSTLSERLMREIRRRKDPGPFFQFGTLARLDSSAGSHFMRTDMTVAQARRSNSFAVGKLSASQLDIAEGIQTRNLESAAGVFASCEWTAESLVGDCGVPRDKIHIIYTGGNLDFSTAGAVEREKNEILFVGRDWDRKGGPLLEEAFQKVRRAIPTARLTIVGCSPAVSSPGIFVEGPLRVHNDTEHMRLQELYLRATCFCLPSHFDPFPNVLIEAAWAGLPVVTVDTGSRAEAVVNGQTGILIPRPDSDLLADALIEVLSDRERAEQMGKLARERAEELFSWDRIVARILHVVKQNGSLLP